VALRREVCTAAAGARSEQEFFTHLAEAGVAVRQRYSTTSAGEVTGYAVGLPAHTAKDGGIVWYGGGKLAADLSLPKLRRRWAGPGQAAVPFPENGLLAAAARAVLRNTVTQVAEQSQDEDGFFAALGEAGVLVRLRFSQTCAGQVTGYAVSLPGHNGHGGTPAWYGGGRLAAGLALPRLRRRWELPRNVAERSGAFRFTAPERNAIFGHAARQAAAAAEEIRRAARRDPAGAADAAWAAADVLHVAARILRSPDLRRAADSYDRAARERYGRIPDTTRTGHELRTTARLLAMTGMVTGEATLITIALAANLVVLAVAVAELREAQQLAAQAAAARAAAQRLYGVSSLARPGLREHEGPDSRLAGLARSEFPAASRLRRSAPASPSPARPRPVPPKRAGPGR
jgi:hypothetical protein